MGIRSFPECLTIILTVASAQQEMSIGSLNAIVCAEIDRKKDSHNPHCKQGSLKPFCRYQNFNWQEMMVMFGCKRTRRPQIGRKESTIGARSQVISNENFENIKHL